MREQSPKMFELIMYFISQTIISYVKPVVIGGFSWLMGSATGLFLQSQNINNPAWYENPVVAAALVTGLFLVITQCIAWLKENKKSKNEKEEKDGERHQVLSEKLQELTQQERKELVGELKGIYEKQIEFLKTQKAIKEIEGFESRMRAHRFGDELTRVHGHVYACHMLMSKAAIEIPDFKLKFYEELMFGLDGEVDKFKENLEKEMERVIHLTG